MMNDDVPQVHKPNLLGGEVIKLNRILGCTHHKKSLSDISGEFCINFSSLPTSWPPNAGISRNSSCNSLASVRTESLISNITGFEDEINEIKRLSQLGGVDDDAANQKISDLNGELKMKILELDGLSELKRDYQSNLIKLQCQESAIISLKDHIREQYCAIQEHKQRAQLYENTIKLLDNEVNVAKKSELWFKNEFHQSQTEKLSLQDRLIGLENENLELKIVCNKLKNNIHLVQINANYIEEKSRREKQLLIDKLSDYDTEIGNQVEYDTIKLELVQLQNKFIEQNRFIDDLTAENDRLARSLSESKNAAVELNIRLQQNERLDESRKAQFIGIKEHNRELSEVNCKLEADKNEIDESIKKLKVDFDLIQARFLQQKRDLELKDSELNELRGKYELAAARKSDTDTKSTNTNDNWSPAQHNNLLVIKNESDDTKKLKILILVLENEYKVKIKRFEMNIRLLLKKIKENCRIRKQLESKYEKCAERNELLVAEKNDVVLNLIKIKSPDLIIDSDRANLLPNLNNYIKSFVDEFNRLYDSNNSYVIKLNSQDSIVSSLNCKLAGLIEKQEKMQIEFSQKEQKFAYELNSNRTRFNTVIETLRTSQQMGVALTHSRHELLQEIAKLNCEIKTLIDDKIRLKNLNSEFKENLNGLLDKKNNRLAAMRNGGGGSGGGSRIDLKRINDLLTKSNGGNNRKPLEPLKTCVDLLRSDMDKLNLIIKQNNSMRYELSLMDELKHAEK